MQTLGSYIKENRILKGLNKSELARRLSITPQYVTDIERDRVVPSEENLEKLVGILELNEVTTFKLADKIPLRLMQQLKREYYQEGD